MWSVVKLFFSANAVRVLEWGGIIAGAVGAVLAVFNSGKKAARVDALEEQVKEIGESHAIQDKNRAELHDGDAAVKLRDDWSR